MSLFWEAKLGTAADDGLKAVSFDALTFKKKPNEIKFI